MRILTCVKHVPDPAGEAGFNPDLTLARARDAGALSAFDAYAVEQALRLRTQLPDAGVAALSVGPPAAASALHRAVRWGVDEAYLVCDDAIAGSDAFGTATVLAAAVRAVGDVGVVVCGMGSTDAGMGVLPALLAHALGWPLLTMAAEVCVTDAGLRIRRLDEHGSRTVRAALPAVLSVTDQTDRPRCPARPDPAAESARVTTLTLADLGVDARAVGWAAARTRVVRVARCAPRPVGTVVTDADGSAAAELVGFLQDQHVI